jgi:hypothetical protein
MKDKQRSRLLNARASDLLTLLLLFIILNATSLHARSGTREHTASFASQQEQAASVNPAGVSFTIRLKDGRKQFEPGEIINLELLFSSRTPQTYSLNNASYDRSGRLLIDSYHVNPQEGVSDPLDDYFNAGPFGFMGGGLSSSSWLDEKPALIASELNDWCRFDRPGKYRLYVTSHRVGRKRDADDDAYHTQRLTLTSNIIEFEILPGDAKWAGQQLREAIAILDAQEQSVNKRAACHTLRFLGTTGAAREMARRLRGVDQECDGEYVFGLVGSPYRALVISEMERLLEAPEHPVSYSFLRTLSLLSFTVQHPASLPPYPDAQDQQQRALWQKMFDERMEKYEQVMNDYVRRLTAAVNGKRGRAQAISFHTLLEISASLAQEKRSAELSAERERIAGALPAIFRELPPDAQFSMLDSYWDQISGPAMLPVLRRIYLRPPETTWEVRDRALQRIYELAPAEGRELILFEARSLHPRVGMEVLGLLPERTLPELDEALADNLEQEFDEIHSALVERYASPAIAARVRAVYGDKGGKMACAIQAPLLAYLLRVDPPQGEALVRQALAARGSKDTGCYDMLLDDVSRLYMCPELERIAVETLSDANIEMVAHAATLLGQYGTATAEEPLWQRFEKWHAEWQEREADLTGKLPGRTSLGAPALADQALVENALRAALSYSGAWLADAEQLKRIRALCLTEKGRLEAEEWAKKWNSPITITLGSVNGIPQSFYVAQYSLPTFNSLKDKLAQFPQGTSFNWKPDSDGLKERQLFNELKDYLEGRGMKLQR